MKKSKDYFKYSDLTFKGGLKYADLPENAKRGLEILQKASDDPKTVRAGLALDVWTETLTDEDKYWLRYTEAGNREMWRRFNLAFELTALLERTK